MKYVTHTLCLSFTIVYRIGIGVSVGAGIVGNISVAVMVGVCVVVTGGSYGVGVDGG